MIAMKFCGVVMPILEGSRPFLWHGWTGVYDKIVSYIHTLVDESQWDSTLAEGTGIPMPQAVAIALRQLDSALSKRDE
jgi:hypothetical protein